MSNEYMADDINEAISAGGYAIVPERAVDGVGRDAIYVYYTENPQTGYSAWKISGGLNGAFFQGFFAGMAVSLLIASIIGLIVTVGFALITILVAVLLVLTFYLAVFHFPRESLDLDCYKLGRSVGALFGGFTGFFIRGIHTTFGLLAYLAGGHWHSYNIDKSNGAIGDGIGSC